MKKIPCLVSLALFVLGGYVGLAHPADTTQAPPAQTAPDNTGRNVRDRRGVSLTPGDQAENKADLALTQRIRKALMADKALSGSSTANRGPHTTAQSGA